MPALGFLQGFLLEKHEKHQCSDMKGADFGGWDPSSAASYSRDRLSPLSTPRLPHLSRGITILVSLGFDLSLCRSLWILRQTQRTLLLPARLATRASVCGTGWLQLPRRCARRLRSPERGAASSSKAGKKQTPSLSLGYTPPPTPRHSSRLLAINATPERSWESEVRASLAWYTQQEAQSPGPEEEDTQHLPRGCRDDEGDVRTCGKRSRPRRSSAGVAIRRRRGWG